MTGLSPLQRISNTLTLIKFSHTVFALPFALISMLVAGQGAPSFHTVIFILLCMVSARTAAMAFNRWADWEFDIQNPRTQNRSRLASKKGALLLCLIALIIFVTGTAYLNRLCLDLSPLSIILVLGYSLTKRFTIYSHAFLGLALSAAPMGAWAATRGELWSLPPYLLAAAVFCWVFGFDLIYATQDVEFDRKMQLFSFPAAQGIEASLKLARLLHLLTFLLLIAFGCQAHLSLFYYIALIAVLASLCYEHVLSKSADLKKINVAFFHVNAFVGLVLLVAVTLDLWMKS